MCAVLPFARCARSSFDASERLTKDAPALEVFHAVAGLQVVDLSHPLHPAMPYWPGEGYGAFRYAAINVLERHGKAAGVFEMPEHMGTHVDAPTHFVASPESIDRIPLKRFIREAVVMDISSRAASDPGTLLEVGHIEAWESHHGAVPPGCVVFVHSGWSARWADADAFRNSMRFPAISREAAQLLLERGVVGIGVDTLSADNGEAPNSPVHRLMHGAGAYILENLANLDRLPPRGAFVVIAPLPIRGGTGAPARVIAFCEREIA
jgi:kynurenine formamidase